MTSNTLTQKNLKSLLSYNPKTGLFIWINNQRGSRNNKIAGGNCGNGYIRICIAYKIYQAHRLAFLYLFGKLPNKSVEIDHINHNRSDNRIKNLRICTRHINSMNRSINKNNVSGFAGVSFAKRAKKWKAQITHKNKRVNLGYYKNINHAVIARWMAEDKYGFHNNHGGAVK